MQTLMLTIEYDGTRYAGWKTTSRKGSPETVSGKIQTALFRLLSEDVQLFCAARTDPGVHARKQILSFQTDSAISPFVLKSNLNQRLPQDIAVLDACQVSKRFHAELLPKHCTWELRIQTGSIPDLFRQKYTLFLPALPDVNRMQEAFSFLAGKHDFRCFSPVKKKKAVIRELYSLWSEQIDDEMHLFLEGSDFLPFMPETLMQLLLDIGTGSLDGHCIPAIFAGEHTYSRRVPAYALYLADVSYTLL